MLGSYSNAQPGQESSAGMALPRFRVLDGSAFGSLPDVELQQLEVRPVLALRILALPMCHAAKQLQEPLHSTQTIHQDNPWGGTHSFGPL